MEGSGELVDAWLLSSKFIWSRYLTVRRLLVSAETDLDLDTWGQSGFTVPLASTQTPLPGVGICMIRTCLARITVLLLCSFF